MQTLTAVIFKPAKIPACFQLHRISENSMPWLQVLNKTTIWEKKKQRSGVKTVSIMEEESKKRRLWISEPVQTNDPEISPISWIDSKMVQICIAIPVAIFVYLKHN